jgi:hypothetical protein
MHPLPKGFRSTFPAKIEARRSARLGGHLRILWGDTADVIPGGFGSYEYMHIDLHTGITINAAERHSMHSAFLSSTECSSTGAAKAEAPSGRGLIAC